MMEIQFDCPHCGTLQGGTYRSVIPFAVAHASAFVTCNRCGKGSVAECRTKLNDPSFLGRELIGVSGMATVVNDLTIYRISPEPRKPRTVHALPPNVERAYLAGEQHIATKHWMSAVAAYRTALERAIRVLDEDKAATKGSLYHRIKAFADFYALPTTLLDLMHSVRDFGNDIHEDEDPSEADALMASDSATLLLTYLFELPARVEAARRRKDEDA